MTRGASGKPDRATRPSDQAPAGLGDTASVPSAILAADIEASEELSWGGISDLNERIHDTVVGLKPVVPNDYLRSLDAAIGLLDPKNDWRRLTPVSMSVFAASPYNAAAQVRYDGYGPTPAAQLCAAFFKMKAAKEEQLAKKVRL